MSLTSRISVQISAQPSAVVGLQTASAPLSLLRALDLASGTGANQADKIFSNTYAIGTGATQSIDVSGSLTDALGGTFVPVKVKVVYISSSASNTTNLTLFGDAASVPVLNTAATTMTLTPGGFIAYANPSAAGLAVAAGTADIIKIVNAAGATANVDVVIIGVSA